MKKAILVSVVLTTRIIVDEDFNTFSDELNENQLDEVTSNLIDKLNNNEIYENIDSLRDDEEMPYSEEYDEIVEPIVTDGFKDNGVYVFEGFPIREVTDDEGFPMLEVDVNGILTYFSGVDMIDPTNTDEEKEIFFKYMREYLKGIGAL